MQNDLLSVSESFTSSSPALTHQRGCWRSQVVFLPGEREWVCEVSVRRKSDCRVGRKGVTQEAYRRTLRTWKWVPARCPGPLLIRRPPASRKDTEKQTWSGLRTATQSASWAQAPAREGSKLYLAPGGQRSHPCDTPTPLHSCPENLKAAKECTICQPSPEDSPLTLLSIKSLF